MRNTRLMGGVFALAIGCVGTYVVIKANAEEPLPITTRIGVTGEHVMKNYSANEEFIIPLNISSHRSATQNAQLIILLSTDRNRLQMLDVTCAAGLTCYKNTTFNGTLRPGLHFVDTMLCIDTPVGQIAFQPGINVKYRAKVNIPAPHPDMYIYWSGWAPGNCQTNQDASGVVWHYGTGACGGEYYVPCDTGSSLGTGPGTRTGAGTGTGGQGSGSSGTTAQPSPTPSAPSSGSSSGRTATNQSSQPNPLPSPSPQGSADKKPAIVASPFYDGRTYESGSDADNFASNLTKSTSGKAGLVVVVTVSFGVIIGVGTYIYRKRRR